MLSGKTTNITVAQILHYSEVFGDIHSAVETADTIAESSSSGVTITAGTPYNFAEKNVEVEMKVTPIVEDDNHNISLYLIQK